MAEIEKQIINFAGKARDGKLSLEEMTREHLLLLLVVLLGQCFLHLC